MGSRRRPRPSSAQSERVVLLVIDESDRVVFARDGVIESGAEGVVEMTIPLAGLQPGGYRVKITAGTSEHSAQQAVGFAVRRDR